MLQWGRAVIPIISLLHFDHLQAPAGVYGLSFEAISGCQTCVTPACHLLNQPWPPLSCIDSGQVPSTKEKVGKLSDGHTDCFNLIKKPTSCCEYYRSRKSNCLALPLIRHNTLSTTSGCYKGNSGEEAFTKICPVQNEQIQQPQCFSENANKIFKTPN